MSVRGNASVNHHWGASSVLTLYDFDGDEPFAQMDPRLLQVYVVDELSQAWWGRALSITSSPFSAKRKQANMPTAVRLRVTAPRCFPSPAMPNQGLLTITLVYPPLGFRKDVPVQVDYVNDDGIC